jgi:hypothetical protein
MPISNSVESVNGSDGVNGTGGGGGGGSTAPDCTGTNAQECVTLTGKGGKGGNGIVIVRYKTKEVQEYLNMSQSVRPQWSLKEPATPRDCVICIKTPYLEDNHGFLGCKCASDSEIMLFNTCYSTI